MEDQRRCFRSKIFRAYLWYLESRGMLRRVRVEVDPDLELTRSQPASCARRDRRSSSSAWKGLSTASAINFMGSTRHIEAILGMHPRELGEKNRARDRESKPALSRRALEDALLLAPHVGGASAPRPPGLMPAVVEDPDLERFPILKCWPKDGGRSLTFPLVITEDPETGVSNMGIYRMQVFLKDTTGVQMRIQKA